MEASKDLAIECRAIVKDYPGHRALDGIDLKVVRGDFHGFLGPNGAGKTTTMRILSGLLGIDQGELFIEGKTLSELGPELSRLVGFMPEVPLLYDSLTVREMLTFSGELKELSRADIKKRIEELSERCQLGEVINRRVGHLSKGYRQRVGLAMALIHNPAVVILDEPTVGLDPVTLGPIRELLIGLKGEHTVLFSSHILSEVQTLCDSVTIINHGRVLKSGPVKSIASELSTGTIYRLEVEGEAQRLTELASKLEALPTVTRVEQRDSGVFEIYCDSGDSRAAISALVVSMGLVLLGLSKSELSLEEIFKAVTSSSQGGLQ